MDIIKIDEELSNRLANMSFVCACLVPSLHIATTFNAGTVSWWLYVVCFKTGFAQIAVPMFFVISGFLLAGRMGEKSWWRSAVEKRIRSLVIPYVFWAFFYLIYPCCITSICHYVGICFRGGAWNEIDLSVVANTLGIDFMRMPKMTHLWFLRSLFVFVLISPLFMSCRQKWFGMFLIVGLMGVSLTQQMVSIPQFEPWFVTFMRIAWVKGLCYFISGIWLRWNGKLASECIRRVPNVVFLAIGTGLFIVDNYCGLVGYQWYGACRTLGFPFAMIGIWRVVSYRRWPSWLTQSAFPMYLCHSAIITVFLGVSRTMVLSTETTSSLSFYLLEYVFTLLGCVGIAVCLRRMVPKFYRVVFGGR